MPMRIKIPGRRTAACRALRSKRNAAHSFGFRAPSFVQPSFSKELCTVHMYLVDGRPIANFPTLAPANRPGDSTDARFQARYRCERYIRAYIRSRKSRCCIGRSVNKHWTRRIKVLLLIFRSTLLTYRQTFRPLPTITYMSRVFCRVKVSQLR